MSETPPCRVCSKTEWVAIYDQAHPERTICVECCGGAVQHWDEETGHQFEHERGEGLRCRYCFSDDVPYDYGDFE